MSKRYLITGSRGQLGKELKIKYPDATAYGRDELDISDRHQVLNIDWSNYDVIINAAAYVNADHSEDSEGRVMAWNANAIGVRNLTEAALKHDLTLVHVSSEYVFDGTQKNHNEEEQLSPLSVYGQTKSAADITVSVLPKHYILRTSWVIGDGHNFVKTMKNLADMRIDPKVVNDQFGRLTFAKEIVRAIDFMLKNKSECGIYNISNSGKIKSWAEIAADVFELAGHDRNRVIPISTQEYSKSKSPFAPRPLHSDMNLEKIKSIGFEPDDYDASLAEYIKELDKVE